MKNRANDIDIIVGNNLKSFRMSRNVTQEHLAREVGVTFQQIQKYERGANRMGSSRLWQMSNVLDIPVERFFDGAPKLDERMDVVSEKSKALLQLTDDEIETAQLIHSLPKPVRQAVTVLISSLASQKNETDFGESEF